jgi:hypothetical protein
MIAKSTKKNIQVHKPIAAVVPSMIQEPHFTIGILLTRAEVERNEWLDK